MDSFRDMSTVTTVKSETKIVGIMDTNNSINDLGESLSAVKLSEDKKGVSVKDMTSQDFYVDPYARHSIQADMVKDNVLMSKFQIAIQSNKHLFKGKTVLEVGCGIGILSMFAADAGASRVIAVDWSNATEYAKKIVAENKLDSIITVIQSKIEDLGDELIPGVDKVDIIISNWMGYCLFGESMLGSVLYARDKWLRPNGAIFPDKFALALCGMESLHFLENNVNWWSDVYGFNMSCLKAPAMAEPMVEKVDREQLSTDHVKILDIDLYTMKKEDIFFNVPFVLRARKDDYVHAIVAHFRVLFSRCRLKTWFTTAPENQWTHWKQTVFYLPNELIVMGGEEILGTFGIEKPTSDPQGPENLHPRELEVSIKIDFDGKITTYHGESKYRLRCF